MTIINPKVESAEAVRQSDPLCTITSEAERVDPLTMYMQTLIGQVRSDCPDLTNRQMALLLIVYIIDAQHTVRSLARHLEVAKPVVSRACDKLELLNYVSRRRGVQDRRDVFLDRTAEGEAFLDKFASRISSTNGFDHNPTC